MFIKSAFRRASRKFHARGCPSQRAAIRISPRTYCKLLNPTTGHVSVTLVVRANRRYPMFTKLFFENKVLKCKRKDENE